MPGSYQKLDIKYMKNLMRLGRVVSVTIHYDFKNNQIFHSRKNYYAYFIISLLLTLYFTSLTGIIQNVVPKMSALEILSESLLYFCIMAFDVNAVLETATKQRKWIKLLDLLETIDSLIKESPTTRNYQNTMNLQITISHISYFVLASLNTYSWIYKFGFKYYRYYIFEVIIKYYVMLITLIICNFTLAIMRRFQYFNGKLKEASMKNNIDICSMKILFNNLVNLTQTYNELFGLQILILLSISVLGLLDVLTYVLDFEYDNVAFLLDLTYFIDTIMLLVNIFIVL